MQIGYISSKESSKYIRKFKMDKVLVTFLVFIIINVVVHQCAPSALKRNILGGLPDVGGVVSGAVDTASNVVGGVVPGVVGTATNVVGGVVPGVVGTVGSLLPGLLNTVTGLLGVLSNLAQVNVLGTPVLQAGKRNILGGLPDVGDLASGVLGTATNVVGGVVPGVVGTVGSLLPGLLNTVTGLLGVLSNLAQVDVLGTPVLKAG